MPKTEKKEVIVTLCDTTQGQCRPERNVNKKVFQTHKDSPPDEV